jgi:Zn-dependent protease with chaperone function
MLRQILGSLLTFLGITGTFVFWYEVIPLGPHFAEWGRDPVTVLIILAVWALAGGFSCLFLSRHIANWAMRVDLLPLTEADADVTRAEAVLAKAAARLQLRQHRRIQLEEQHVGAIARCAEESQRRRARASDLP